MSASASARRSSPRRCSRPRGACRAQREWQAFAGRASEGKRLQQEALSAAHVAGNFVASGDYEIAIAEGETFLELVRALRDRKAPDATEPGDGD